MTLRTTVTLATLTLLTACGPTDDRPWDQNHDGLITACEGLNPQACDATPGCERVALACTMECRDDGHGGCLPCAGGDVCRPVTTPVPPPTLDCSTVATVICQMVPGCALQTVTVCSGGGAPTDPTFTPPCGNGCHEEVSCVNTAPRRCEDLDVDACLSKPGCAIEQVGATCDVACAPGQACPPCATPVERCVTLPPPVLCEARDVNTCSFDGQCELSAPTCESFCDPSSDAGCSPCPPVVPVCVPVTVMDGGTPSRCADLDRNSCEAAGCVLYQLGIACTTECRDDGDGGCLPCKDYVCSER